MPAQPAPMADRPARKLRYPDHVAASWTEVVLGADAYGQWAVLPAGSPVHRDSGTVLRYDSPQLFCYPYDGWWVARFGGPDAAFAAYRSDGAVVRVDAAEPDRVDIGTPARLDADGGISFVDLTLDLVRRSDGTVVVLDEHEVDEEAGRLSIPPDHVANARRSCERVARMLAERVAPFDDTPAGWLTRSKSERPIGGGWSEWGCSGG